MGNPVSIATDSPAALARLDSLTGLRFFAAYLVVQHHFTNFAQLPGLYAYTGFGATGVTFFFVLSGFVLTWSFVPSDTPPRFYWRRFARVWPLHVVTTALALPVFYSFRDIPFDWTAITLSFLLLHAWVPTATTYFAGNPASWSLSCELFFYALHPFFVRPTLRAGLIALGVLTVIIMGASYIVADLALDWPARLTGWLLYISPLFRVAEFILGVLLAAAMKRGFRAPIGVLPATILIALWFHLFYQVSPDHFSSSMRIAVADLQYVVLPLLYAAAIAGAAQLDLDRKRSVLRAKPMVLLGQWSYALYLIHATVIYAFIHWFGARAGIQWEHVRWLVAISIICIAASALLYYAIEHPVESRLRRLQKQWIARRGGGTALPANPAQRPADA